MRMPRRIPTRNRGRRRGGFGGGRLGLIVIAAIGFVIYWFMNQQEVGLTGRNQFNTISIQDEARLGAQSYHQIMDKEGTNVLCSEKARACEPAAKEIVDFVREIGIKLEKAAIELEKETLASGRQFTPVAEAFNWEYNVVASNQPNAFCLPGGKVAIYTGILDITGNSNGELDRGDLADPDKLAVVMGHEIGHALAHHGAERMSQGQLAQMGQMAVGLAVGDMDPGMAQQVMAAFGVAAQTGLILPFSRAHETEADEIGLRLLVRACYDPREAPELWMRMGKLGGGGRQPAFLSTHPEPEARAQNFKRLMPAAIAEYERFCGPLR